jgi:L-ascorbate metabolism protein UlaG (beta-lactamase superfamily)
MRMNIYLVALFLLAIVGLYSCRMLSVKTYKGAKSDHFDGRRFIHPDGNKMGNFRELMRYQLTHKKARWPYLDTIAKQPSILSTASNEIRYKVINHATVLIQHHGVNILTDPVFGKRASPFKLIGPKRHRPPALSIDELPKIDILLLSHDHFDHLDAASLKILVQKWNPKIFVGLGLKAYLAKFDITNVEEMDWQQKADYRGLQLMFLPAKHWSNRGFSPFKTLWGSFMISSPTRNIYFAGDTGFYSHFEDIKGLFPTIDLALIPIGAYIPRSFMQYVHMPPEDAVRAHQILDPRLSVAIHWGTFQLTGEGMYDPVDLLQELCDAMKVDNFIYDRHHDQYGVLE